VTDTTTATTIYRAARDALPGPDARSTSKSPVNLSHEPRSRA
jgi:hypothetical protein